MKKSLILIAPDKFKGTLSSFSAAKIIKKALLSCEISADIKTMEMADGGEGSAKLLAGKRRQRIFYDAAGCVGQKLRAAVWVDPDTDTAYIDSAEVIGMKRKSNLSVYPTQRTSYYLGVLLKQLIERYTKVGLCVGGTATVDCGIGMIEALGAKFTIDGNARDKIILISDLVNHDVKCDWGEAAIETLREKLKVYVDVDVPLIAAPGLPSSLMFARQKGVNDMAALEVALRRYAALFPKGELSGAGGGLASALGAMGVEIVSGAEALCARIISETDRRKPDLIITGEGSIDAQSFEGKVVGTLYSLCAKRHIPMLAIGGICDSALPARPGLKIIATIDKPQKYLSATQAAENLKIAAIKAARELSSFKF